MICFRLFESSQLLIVLLGQALYFCLMLSQCLLVLCISISLGLMIGFCLF